MHKSRFKKQLPEPVLSFCAGTQGSTSSHEVHSKHLSQINHRDSPTTVDLSSPPKPAKSPEKHKCHYLSEVSHLKVSQSLYAICYVSNIFIKIV